MVTLPAVAPPVANTANIPTTATIIRFMSHPPRLVYRPGNCAGKKADHEGHATVAQSFETATARRWPPTRRRRPCGQHRAGRSGQHRRPAPPFTRSPLTYSQASEGRDTDWLQMGKKLLDDREVGPRNASDEH